MGALRGYGLKGGYAFLVQDKTLGALYKLITQTKGLKNLYKEM